MHKTNNSRGVNELSNFIQQLPQVPFNYMQSWKTSVEDGRRGFSIVDGRDYRLCDAEGSKHAEHAPKVCGNSGAFGDRRCAR